MSVKERLQRSAREYYDMSLYWLDNGHRKWAIYYQNEAAWYYSKALHELH